MNLKQISSKYLTHFSGDFSGNMMQRQTPKVIFCTVNPAGFSDPELLIFNQELSKEIGLGKYEEKDLEFLVGNIFPKNIQPFATAYAGHQFGNWAGQLGDGRAIYIGEIQNNKGKTTELQWKGAGATPYSRFADGRAVLRSSLREYLMSEALFHLDILTTRALSLALTGENVVRDIMYNGNPTPEKGAVIIRTAESFLRFGHFEWLSAQKEIDTLRKLVDFSISNYFPEINTEDPEKYKSFFVSVTKKTAQLMVDWFRVGFTHGVMNTDNMSILGLTIDYGPFSMLDAFDLSFTPNTTDLPGRRYAFGSQPSIAQWNLWQLANALFPLINDTEFLEKTLEDYSAFFWKKHDEMMGYKFGFEKGDATDGVFFTQWQKIMTELEMDYTLFFNAIEKLTEQTQVKDFLETCSYQKYTPENEKKLSVFLEKYKKRLAKNTISKKESSDLMKKNNPKFILRNYLLYQCIEEIELGKKELLEKLLVALQYPYEEIYPEFSVKRPSKFNDVVGCSMLSCSS